MGRPMIRGIRNTAEVTRKLNPQIESRTVDGTPILIRTLVVRFERHKGKGWSWTELKASAALPKTRSDEWREDYYYYEANQIVLNDQIQQQIQDMNDLITKQSARYACTVA